MDQGLIIKGIVSDGVVPPNCEISSAQWTYNSGVILSALTDLYAVTGKIDYKILAKEIALSSMDHFVQLNSSVFMEVNCESDPNSDCGNDAPQFKGVFVRNLVYLYESSDKELKGRFEVSSTTMCNQCCCMIPFYDANTSVGSADHVNHVTSSTM